MSEGDERLFFAVTSQSVDGPCDIRERLRLSIRLLFDPFQGPFARLPPLETRSDLLGGVRGEGPDGWMALSVGWGIGFDRALGSFNF